MITKNDIMLSNLIIVQKLLNIFLLVISIIRNLKEKIRQEKNQESLENKK